MSAGGGPDVFRMYNAILHITITPTHTHRPERPSGQGPCPLRAPLQARNGAPCPLAQAAPAQLDMYYNTHFSDSITLIILNKATPCPSILKYEFCCVKTSPHFHAPTSTSHLARSRPQYARYRTPPYPFQGIHTVTSQFACLTRALKTRVRKEKGRT